MTAEMEVHQKVDGAIPVVKKPYKMELVWRNVLLFVVLHASMIYGFTYQKKLISIIVGWTIGFMQGDWSGHLKCGEMKESRKKMKFWFYQALFRCYYVRFRLARVNLSRNFALFAQVLARQSELIVTSPTKRSKRPSPWKFCCSLGKLWQDSSRS